MAELHFGAYFEFENGASQTDNPEEVDHDYDLDKNISVIKQEEEGCIAHSNDLIA